jgi:cephalosporin hydroxylase
VRLIKRVYNSFQKRIVKGVFKNCIINNFSRLFYYHAGELKWMGIRTLKNHSDLWIYQEMIHEQQPDFIIETGTRFGGSALYLAHICDIIGKGKIITIDTDTKITRPIHERIEYIGDSSTSPKVLAYLNSILSENHKVLFILDSDHSKKHVLDELRLFQKFIKKGEYIIVEDTNINGHPLLPHFGPGPMEAVQDFLKENKSFIADRTRERLFHTHNPKGYLKRIV